MSTELAIIQPKQDVSPAEFTHMMNVGQVLAQSGFFADARQAAQAVTKMLYGRELGVGFIASLSGISIIEGKLSVGAHLMAAAIKRSSVYDYKIVESNDGRCEVAFYENGELQGTVAMTLEEAKQSGLTNSAQGIKKNWRMYPGDMLFARVISRGLRRYCPNVFDQPVYVEDELRDADVAPAHQTLPEVTVYDEQPTPEETRIYQQQFDAQAAEERIRLLAEYAGLAADANARGITTPGGKAWAANAEKLPNKLIEQGIESLHDLIAKRIQTEHVAGPRVVEAPGMKEMGHLVSDTAQMATVSDDPEGEAPFEQDDATVEKHHTVKIFAVANEKGLNTDTPAMLEAINAFLVGTSWGPYESRKDIVPNAAHRIYHAIKNDELKW